MAAKAASVKQGEGAAVKSHPGFDTHTHAFAPSLLVNTGSHVTMCGRIVSERTKKNHCMRYFSYTGDVREAIGLTL